MAHARKTTENWIDSRSNQMSSVNSGYYRNDCIRFEIDPIWEQSGFKLIRTNLNRSQSIYMWTRSMKENSLRPWVKIPEDNRHSTVTRHIPLFSVEHVTISGTHYWVHWFLSVKYFTCKKCLDWDIFIYFYFFSKYIAFLSLIVKKWSLHISYNMKNISLSFCSILYDIFN